MKKQLTTKEYIKKYCLEQEYKQALLKATELSDQFFSNPSKYNQSCLDRYDLKVRKLHAKLRQNEEI